MNCLNVNFIQFFSDIDKIILAKVLVITLIILKKDDVVKTLKVFFSKISMTAWRNNFKFLIGQTL